MAEINIADLIAHIKAELKKEMDQEFSLKLDSLTSRQNELTTEMVSLRGGDYTIQVDADGLIFLRKGKQPTLTISKNGQAGFNMRSPRTVGNGSMHMKVNNGSQGNIPSTGVKATKGLLIDADGDDAESYGLRVLSRMNRNGFNVFSEGSLAMGSMEKIGGATIGVLSRYAENPVGVLRTNNKDFQDTILRLETTAPSNKNWKGIRVTQEVNDELREEHIFEVDGQGNTKTKGGFYTNMSGYAEMFEWADGNPKEESREGFVVSLDTQGKLKVANEGDKPIGVVIHNAAFVGNSQWNAWHGMYATDAFKNETKEAYQLIEWVDEATSTMVSFYKDSMSASYQTPSGATEIQTDENGDDLLRSGIRVEYDPSQEYESRKSRPEWATVCLFGSAPVFKGQHMPNTWIKIKSLTDEVELVIIK